MVVQQVCVRATLTMLCKLPIIYEAGGRVPMEPFYRWKDRSSEGLGDHSSLHSKTTAETRPEPVPAASSSAPLGMAGMAHCVRLHQEVLTGWGTACFLESLIWS